MKSSPIILFLLGLLIICPAIQAQTYSPHGIKISYGIGMHKGRQEGGLGSTFSIGYQKSYLNQRLRLNPYIMSGSFSSYGLLDARDQYYRSRTLGCTFYLDAIRYRAVSLFIGTGPFLNYSRGLLGTGGFPDDTIRSSQNFFEFYAGGHFSAGLRIAPKDRRIAYEFCPINIFYGTQNLIMGLAMIGIDIRLNK